MRAQRTQFGWMLRLDEGEEIVESLRAFAERERVRCASISGLGACGEAELGFYVRETRSYVRRTFTGEHEIGSLTGNVSALEGRAFPHCHAVLSGPDLAAHTGHLFRAVVTVTCEVALLTDAGVLVRALRPDLGFNPLAPE